MYVLLDGKTILLAYSSCEIVRLFTFINLLAP